MSFIPSVRLCVFACLLVVCTSVWSAEQSPVRERVLLDKPWKFALGHAADPLKDFDHGTGYFSFISKTGFGEGAASAYFDDRSWREVSIPHDWAVEMPIANDASHSHGYRTVGPRYPQYSVGWYRHRFFIPEADLDKRIRLEFDGIQRKARVFVNGFFLGEEWQGNVSQSYDITPYLNYGGENVIAVRADVSIEEGWYYEGAGINRHVYLSKTSAVHVDLYGTFVRAQPEGKHAHIDIDTTIVDERENAAYEKTPDLKVIRTHTVLDAQGKKVAESKVQQHTTLAGQSHAFTDAIKLKNARLWDLHDPYLYTLVTRLEDGNGTLLDEYETPFGVRSIHFDPDRGFFLNGRQVKLKGSNNHEDHAGVGTATPDSLIEYRLQLLKDLGMNAYRASHAAAAPALLDIADRMGMLVINEARLMGVNDYHMDAVEHIIKRDRNHPSIILWSLGNEEWAIESNIKGARITKTMQSRARQLDPTRLNTVAISGGWGGISTEVEVMGVNYIRHGSTDEQHKNYPWQIILGTEETTTQQTRGIYYEDKAKGHLPSQEDGSSGGNAESGWRHYAERDYAAGIFYWTGFDYRGEPTPYAFPAISSQFGILDMCGFPKDGYYYLKAWWTDKPVLHIARHWNWRGREDEVMPVVVQSNAEEVELFLNGASLGKKAVKKNDHLEWKVSYQPGELKAVGYTGGKASMETIVATTGPAAQLALDAHVNELAAGSPDVAVINVSVRDNEGRVMPLADNLLHFSISGPGKIIGVGNGNPSSHEPDVYVNSIRVEKIGEWKAPDTNDAQTPIMFEARFDMPKLAKGESARLLINALGDAQSLQINGEHVQKSLSADQSKTVLSMEGIKLKAKGNTLRMEATPFNGWGERNNLHSIHPVSFLIETPAEPYKRKAFNGWAQVIVQVDGNETGELKLSANSEGLQAAEVTLQVK